MARDSSATKARLLDAAFSEFAAYGIAGARVDRIAEAAQANKRLIYVYYGNKEQLFDAVLQQALETGSESVPFDARDLPGYAGAIFDHLVERPDLMRLVQWKQLERPGTTDAEAESYRGKIAAVEQAQRAGGSTRSWIPRTCSRSYWASRRRGRARWAPRRRVARAPSGPRRAWPATARRWSNPFAA